MLRQNPGGIVRPRAGKLIQHDPYSFYSIHSRQPEYASAADLTRIRRFGTLAPLES